MPILPIGRHPGTVVVIPARNEAVLVDACLDALALQQTAEGRLLQHAFSALLLVNNSSDNTAEKARARAATLPFQLHVREIELPPHLAHAGGARRAAMDWAAQELGAGPGVLCCTDADSAVDPHWIFEIWRALDGGVDAVAGSIEFNAEELRERPFPQARRLEGHYAILQAEVIARLDPEPHNPWPNHLWTWGASIAVTLDAYRAIGGLPCQPLAEDRALTAALRTHDFKIRHSTSVRVRTSQRDVGRAAGGLADLVRLYGEDDTHPCDAELEPILIAAERAKARRRLRLARGAANDADWLARRLGVEPSLAEGALSTPLFGAAWAYLEARMPRLKRVSLRPDQLPMEIARADRLLARLRPIGAGGPGDNAGSAPGGLWSSEARPA